MPTAAPAPASAQSLAFATLPDNRWPGRLVVGGKTLDDFVAISEEPHADAGWTLRVFQSVSTPQLQIRAKWRTINRVTEWNSTLVNNAPKPSPKVTEVRSLAASWQTRGPVDFYGTKNLPVNFDGVRCLIDDIDGFGDRTELDIDTVELIPRGGRSSNTIFPFFAVTDRHDSLAIGIGWSGRWCATLRHASGALQVEVGLPQVGIVLRPWESIRLPSVLLAAVPEASAEQARRTVRAHLTQHVVPQTPDGKSPHFTAYCTMHGYIHLPDIATDEAAEMAALERAAAMGIETCWVDAVWFGNTPTWSSEVGNWNIRRSDFPRGLRPISDRAHELGLKFLFWLEPERARPTSEWARAHPDLFLPYPDNGTPGAERRNNLILNLADPRAVDLAFNKATSLITEFNADIYRQDFNISPLDFWYAADAPDRVGITEIRYIEGLYALWDRILAAHPGILIDNCASGGLRIDLETLRRSVPMWRSDLGCFNEAIPQMDIINQLQCWGLGQWLPDHGGPIRSFDAYATRSSLSTGFMIYRPLPTDKSARDYVDAVAAIAENKRLRPLITEERIGLIQPTEAEAWAAFQHHRHSDSSGFIVALRGPGAADQDTVTLRPEHIDTNATYQVIRWDDYKAAAPTQVAGAALNELAVTIAQTRSSVLIEYTRV